ncbi:MAG: cyclic nucleotide-binding domain-containing protein [Alphaproteobacteria bacterium]|nr:cyclic nucleotide-binding domain-containing protein [Alphaproteobacteria bacterium]
MQCNVRLIAFCGILDDSDIHQLERISKDRIISRNKTVFMQGEQTSNFYNIKRGSLKIYKLSSDGRKQIVGFLFPGDFVGMSPEENYSYNAETLEETTLCTFSRIVLENFFVQHPHVERKILNIVNHELSVAQDQIFLLGKYTAKERLLQFFLNLSKQRNKLGWVDNPLRLSMSRSDIANYLGLTIETISRTISELKTERLIRMIGTQNIFLQDKGAIHKLLISEKI